MNIKTYILVLILFAGCNYRAEKLTDKAIFDTIYIDDKSILEYKPKIDKTTKNFESFEPLEIIAISLADFSSQNKEMIKYSLAVEKHLKESNDKPDEYFISSIDFINDTVEIHLYHKSAFEEMRKAWKKGLIIIGNPSGRCGTAIYLESKNEVIEILSWQ